MDLSVIIVNYRTRDRLQECLRALEHARGPTREVIVVDNASGDGSVEMVRTIFPTVGLVSNPYNYGFSIANNQAYRISRGRYVMTLNPDAIVSEGSLAALVDFMERTPAAGLAAPAFVDAEDNVEPTRYSLPPIERPHLLRMLRGAIPEGRNSPVEIRWIWGTGYLCRRQALESQEFFREETFLFGEEYDLCKRLRSRGYTLYLVPQATLHHAVSASYRWEAASFSNARRLGVAVLWRIRRKEHGTVRATANQLTMLADSAILWLALGLTGLLKNDGRKLGRRLGRVDYGARVAASMGVLALGERYLRQMDDLCWLHFNSGSRPPRLPQPSTWLPWAASMSAPEPFSAEHQDSRESTRLVSGSEPE